MTSELDRLNQLELAKTIVLRLSSPGGVIDMARLMRDTRSGLRSASLDHQRGDRYEDANPDRPDKFRARIPSDPTGEAAMHPDPADDALDDMNDLLDALHDNILDLANLHDMWSPAGKPKIDHKDDFHDQWCRSCWRAEQTCTPITKRPNGRPYYVGMCRWCGDLRAQLGMRTTQLPPRTLVTLHLAGQPITQPLIAKHTVAGKNRKRRGRGRKAA